MKLSTYLLKNLFAKTVKKGTQAASWLPAINLRLQEKLFLAGYKVTRSSILESTAYGAGKLSHIFKRYAEDNGPAPLAAVEDLTKWFMADVAFGMEEDARKISLIFNKLSTTFEMFSNLAGNEARSRADAYYQKEDRQYSEDLEEVTFDDIYAETKVYSIVSDPYAG